MIPVYRGGRGGTLAECSLTTNHCPQYLGILVSIRSAHAVIPPVRLCTLVKPACCRKATALALRPPILQWATISRLESSSLTRFGRSPSGIRYPFKLQI